MSDNARVDYRDVLAALGAMMAEAGDEGSGLLCPRDCGGSTCLK